MLLLPFINFFRWLGNIWRRLWRRRADYVWLDITGALPEFAPGLSLVQRRVLRQQAPLSVQELRRRLQRIAADPNARGVLLRIDGLDAGWATLQSVRDELRHFRATSGKQVLAYVLQFDPKGYYLACAADTILAPPTATFFVLGVRAEVQYLRDALAKVGITAEVEAVSPYKAAGEQFVRNEMSPENRAQLGRIVEQRYAMLVAAIAEGRSLAAEVVGSLIDAAPFDAPFAHNAALIDALLYEDELAAYLRRDDDTKDQPIMLRWDDADGALQKPYARFRPKLIGVVQMQGSIVAGASRVLPLPLPLIGGAQAGADSISQALRQAERSKRVAAVVLYVDSPGGDAFASDLIWREVLRLRQRKPVVVMMGNAAASGGYYVAAPASFILAQPGTLTGSIGVVSLRPVLAGLLDRAGINTVVLSKGDNTGLLSLSNAPSDSERQALRRQIQSFYTVFKGRVRDGRGIDEATLEPIAGGRVWLGQEALELKLVDGLGGLPEAVLKAQELADMPAERDTPLMLLRGGRDQIAPQSFPADTLASLLHTAETALRTSIWAVLPFEGL